MTTIFILAAALLLTAFAIPAPGRRILPVYAFIVPAGSVVEVELPLPPPFNTVSSLVGACVMVAIVVHLAAYRNGRVPSLPLATWALFLAWATATTIYAIDPRPAVETVIVAVPLVMLVLTVGMLPRADDSLDAVRLGVILSGIAVGVYAIGLLASGSSFTEAGPGGRFVIGSADAATDPNILAASLLLPLAFSVERLIFGGTRYVSARAWRALGLAGALLTVLAITITGSRGGLTSALAAFLLVLWFARKQPGAGRMVRRAAVTVLGSVGALLGLALIAAEVAPGSRIEHAVQALPLGRFADTELGGSGRAEIWSTAARLCPQHCPLGSGIGTFPRAFTQEFAFSGEGLNIGAELEAHNIFLEVPVELGFPGLTLLLLALIAEWRALVLADPRRTVAVKAAFVSVLLANLFLSTLWFKYFWLVIALVRMVEGRPEIRGEAPVGSEPARVPVGSGAG